MDKVGTRTAISETRDGTNYRLLEYEYDNVYRLTEESETYHGGTPTVTGYAYDDAGNRISKIVGAATYTYVVDKLNRVTSYSDNNGTIATYTYDLNGNRATKTANSVTHTSTYDRDNRLVAVNDGSGNIFTASYDYRTRRYEKLENGSTTRYIYDGGVNVQEYAVDAQGQSSLTKQLIRGTGMGGGIGSVLYSETVSSGSVTNTEYFAYNAVGSVVALLNGSGTVTSTSDFEAFGSEVRNSGSTTETRKFCTKERDSSIGLDNFGFRYYDAELGRFVQRDPSGYPDGPNNYLYCHNNPINFVDPLGLEELNYQTTLFGTRVYDDGSIQVQTRLGYIAQTPIGHAMAIQGKFVRENTMPALKVASETFTPGHGEISDAITLADPKSSKVDKAIAAGSLYLGFGPLPNMGPVIRAGKKIFTKAFRKTADSKVTKKIFTKAFRKNADKIDDLTETAVNKLKKSGVDVDISPQQRGRIKEAEKLEQLGETKNTTKYRGDNGTNTIPDYVNKTDIGEIKDTKRLSNTKQIQAQREVAQNQGKNHVIQTGTKTRVSKRVERESIVVRNDDLGPQ